MHDDLSAHEFTGDGERFSLAPGERDGVRVGGASNLSGIFSHLRDSRSLRELLPAAGCKFQFDAATIKSLVELVELVRAELNRF